MEHTPGPWRIKQQPKKSIWVIADDGFHIAEVNKYAETHGDKKDLANAHVLAAAPDLLAALEGLIVQADDPDNASGDDLVDMIDWPGIRAAIAKAKGAAWITTN